MWKSRLLTLAVCCAAGCYPDPSDAPFVPRDPGDVGADSDVLFGEDETVYVDRAAAAGGDGSASAPFRTLIEGLETDKGRVVIAAGSYDAPDSWTFDTLRQLDGAGADLTTLSHGNGLDWRSEDGLLMAGLRFTSYLKVTGSLHAAATSWHDGLLLVGGDEPVSLTGCDATNRGIRVERSTQFAATDLRLAGIGGTGLRLEASTSELVDIDIRGISETPNDEGDGLEVVSGVVTVTGGTISTVGTRAVVLDGATAQLDGLAINDATVSGIHLEDRAEAVLNNVDIIKTGAGVVVATRSEVTATDLDVNDSRVGATVGARSTLRWTGGRLSDTSGDGVRVEGEQSELHLRDVHLTRVGMTCVEATNFGAVTVRGGSLTMCGTRGVAVESGNDLVVEGTAMSNTGSADPLGAGLAVEDVTEVLIMNVTMLDQPWTALRVRGEDLTLIGSRFERIGGAAVDFQAPEDTRGSMRAVDNHVISARTTAFRVRRADLSATRNRLVATLPDGALADGMILYDTAATLESNTLERMPDHGIVLVWPSAATLQGNTFTDGIGPGLYLVCNADGVEPETTIGDNTGLDIGRSAECLPP